MYDNSADNASLGKCNLSVDPSLREPQNIDQASRLIAALPKPLTVDCFVEALKPPLKIFAVDNAFSAQPSAGMDSPRIFIINRNLILSIVPAGPGRDMLELSQIVSTTHSVKGEIEFPVKNTYTLDAPYMRIYNGSSGTGCALCHGNERLYPSAISAFAYESEIVKPSPFRRVTQTYLKNQSLNCDSFVDPVRCDILRAVFITGQAQDVPWPTP